MDLRSLPPSMHPHERINARRKMIEEEFGVDCAALASHPAQLGHAEERNCENMFGIVPIPVGLAGPLTVTVSDGTETIVHLPLATTEGALVASVNRGCKALRGVRVDTASQYHGVTRSMALRMRNAAHFAKATRARECGPLHQGYEGQGMRHWICEHEKEWKAVGEATSSHLKILSYEIDEKDDHVFLTIAADTDEAMGMNMVTIAAQAIGEWMEHAMDGIQFITVAANVDSDKKPSVRTYTKGRGYEASATCNLQPATITEILKTTPEAMLAAAKAKLEIGSKIAGAIGANLQAANVIAALYLATGQDAAHVVEGAMADTTVSAIANHTSHIPTNFPFSILHSPFPCLKISTRIPALLLGIRGGGTTLPAQKQCLDLLLQSHSAFPGPRSLGEVGRMPHVALHPCRLLAELCAAAVLAGEISLLAAQANHTLARAHKNLGR